MDPPSQNDRAAFSRSFPALAGPRQVNPAISPQLEQVLLKAMRLQLTGDGKIDRCPGYTDFAEFIADLKTVELPA